MIAILSPAKRLVEVTPSGARSEPEFEHRARALAGLLREYPAWQLESVLRVNAELALEAYLAYQRFGESGARSPALLSFCGLQYRQLDAASLTEGQMEYAQDHLRLLSALYGVLRPLDGIASYRLEMISAFRPGGQTLYRYWGDALCRSLFRSGQLVLNLASQEYARAVKPHLRPGDRMWTWTFLPVCAAGTSPRLPTPRWGGDVWRAFWWSTGQNTPNSCSPLRTRAFALPGSAARHTGWCL